MIIGYLHLQIICLGKQLSPCHIDSDFRVLVIGVCVFPDGTTFLDLLRSWSH